MASEQGLKNAAAANRAIAAARKLGGEPSVSFDLTPGGLGPVRAKITLELEVAEKLVVRLSVMDDLGNLAQAATAPRRGTSPAEAPE